MPAPEKAPRSKSKTWATWAALLGGAWGLHRFYLYGMRDKLAWLHPIPTLVGLYGLQRVSDFGQDDQVAWLLIPILGFMIAGTMLQGIVYGLTDDTLWHRRHNPALAEDPNAPRGGWPVVIGVILSLLIGATVLMATIAFSGQRFFEYQIEEGRKISQ